MARATDAGVPVAPVRGFASAPAPARSSTVTGGDLRARTRLRSGSLQQRAAAEVGWVNEDLRRIAVICVIMLAGLAIAWLLLVVLGLGDLY